MAEVKYTGPPNQPCDELYEFNLAADNPKVPVPGKTYEVPKEKVAPFVMNAHFRPADEEAKAVYDDLVKRGIVVDPGVAAAIEGVPEGEGKVDATEGAIELAAALGIDLATAEMEGTGQDGRIQKPDVEKYAEENGITPPDEEPAKDPATGEERTPGNGSGGEA